MVRLSALFSEPLHEYEGILGEDDPVVMTGQVNLDENPRSFSSKIEKLKQEAETGFQVFELM